MNNPLQFAVYIISLLALAIILIKAASEAVSELELIAKYTKIKSFALASLLVALSTSLPEFVIAVSASLKQQAELALGMIMGSNIANISLTIGLAALIGGMVRSSDKLLKREVLYAFLIGTVPSILLLDGTLSRLDGMVLCSLYVVYVVKELVAKKAKPKENHSEKNITTSLKTKVHRWANSRFERHLLIFIVSIAILIGVGEIMVAIAMQLTSLSQLPILLIGVMVLSVGTALPELALEIEAIRKREMNMAFGGIIGSIVINATLILGLTSIISPINLTVGLKPYLLSVVCFILLFGLFWKFTGSKHRLERWEGGVLVLTYLLFAAAQFYLNI